MTISWLKTHRIINIIRLVSFELAPFQTDVTVTRRLITSSLLQLPPYLEGFLESNVELRVNKRELEMRVAS
jgi:hypothetical protein